MKSIIRTLVTCLAVLSTPQLVASITLDVSDETSICSAAALIADGTLDYYEGTTYGGTVGMFTNPYYWWEAGEAFGSLLGYWYFCQNDTYEDLIYEALLAQRGDDDNYIPSNQSTTEGNDDQGFWGLAVMEAAERNFTNPSDDIPGWLALTQAVFNTMWARWDEEYCGGGLRWQIFTWNSGYNYKNTISNGCLFNIAARLGRYTGNDTYIDVASTTYDWLVDIGFVVEGDSAVVYDGAETDDNCTSMTTYEWSYNYALLLAGSAYAYNATEDEIWLTRTNMFLNGALTFFEDSIMYEKTCQGSGTCNTDQRSFRSIFARCLGQTSVLVSETYDTIRPLLEASAAGAAQSCVGGTDGHTCGLDWTYSGWDGYYGLGEQIAALEIVQNLLASSRDAPYTNVTGGTSSGDSSAGISSIDSTTTLEDTSLTIKTKDKAASAVITAVVLVTMIGGTVWMMI